MSHARPSPTIRCRSLAVVPTLMLGLASSVASAIEVTTTLDENGGNTAACALREAVRAINTQSSFGGCVFTPGDTFVALGADTYQLSLNVGVTDRVAITKPMTIAGQGPGRTIVERVGAFDDDMLFVVVREPGSVLLEGFTLRGATGRFNSAIDFLAEDDLTFTLRDMVFRDNHTETGAPFRIQGDGSSPVIVERVVFEDNTQVGSFADGGGIDCSASETESIPSLRLVDVLFRNNALNITGSAFGGGLYAVGCDVSLENVTFDSNSVTSANEVAAGGGMLVLAGDQPNAVTLTNVTFFGNRAQLAGGFGQSQDTDAVLTVTLSNVTFADNVATQAGDHFFQDRGATGLRNVLFGPSAGTACDESLVPDITLLGGNMDADGSCGVERTEPDPGLADGLTFDGGLTPTVALRAGAAAIDAGTDAGCPATDQRGALRPFDGDGDQIARCDIGAYERGPLSLFTDGFESGGAGKDADNGQAP